MIISTKVGNLCLSEEESVSDTQMIEFIEKHLGSELAQVLEEKLNYYKYWIESLEWENNSLYDWEEIDDFPD